MVGRNKKVKWGFKGKNLREFKAESNNRRKRNQVKNIRPNLGVMSEINGATLAKININRGLEEKYGSDWASIQDF